MFNKELIKQREDKLEEARVYLKNEFVGIDEIIDKFIHSIRIWYILPEIQTRPLIVNLWGITGVGKTDLVRKFVNFVEFSDKFAEIQMDSKDGNATIEDYLEMVLENNETQGVLLLDEIQRFRSINEEGKENNSNKYQDLWMLLSDGTFQSDSKIKHELIKLILEDEYWSQRWDDDDDDDDDLDEDEIKEKEKKKKKMKELKYKTSYWEANKMKKMLKLEESVEEIMKLDKLQKIDLIKEKLKSKETFEGKKYKRLLIIVSGNLDEAFTMADEVNDADRDADVYHDFSKTIDIVTIKGALRSRFKPEQIARLGNIHLIYPILSKAAYMDIIKKRVTSIVDDIKKNHKIKIKVDKSVYEVIYDNGVFPTQGVRPLLSTISSIVENSLPTFLYEYLNVGSRKTIKLRHKDGYLISDIEGKEISYEIPRVLDDIKDNQTENDRALVAIHEAGHAIVYSLLFKTAPTQVVASTANHNNGGFVGTHSHSGNKEHLLKTIQVTLAGRIAENIVFGEDGITNGNGSDYQYATMTAAGMIRFFGMGENIGMYSAPSNGKDRMLHDIDKTDEAIEKILMKEYNNAETLIKNNLELLGVVAERLMKQTNLTPTEFKELTLKTVLTGITRNN
jgi:hypothetical protein